MNDSQLIDLLRTDPNEGLRQTVQTYSPYVLKIAYNKLGGVCQREDIEEAVSDIFLMFYKSLEKVGFEVGSVKGFLSVIAARHCINVYERAAKQQPTLSFEEIEETIADSPSDSQALRLAEAIKALGSPDTEIFMRKYFFGQKSREIAKALHIRTNTVDKRISRGLVRLRKILEEEMP